MGGEEVEFEGPMWGVMRLVGWAAEGATLKPGERGKEERRTKVGPSLTLGPLRERKRKGEGKE